MSIRSWLKTVFGDQLVIDLLQKQLVKVETDCDARLREKDTLIAEYRGEIAVLKTKIDGMEQVLMPLTGKAGAIYQDHLHPRPRRERVSVEPNANQTQSWDSYKRLAEDELRKQEEEQSNASSQQEST